MQCMFMCMLYYIIFIFTAAFSGTLTTGSHSYTQNAIINNYDNVLNPDTSYSGGIYTVPAGWLVLTWCLIP